MKGLQMATDSRNRARLRGMNLFAVVLEELAEQVGGEFSTEELMIAAQHLIELSKNDYAVTSEPERASRPNYYSTDVLTAFETKQLQILRHEAHAVDSLDHNLIPIEIIASIKRLSSGIDEMRWEF